MKQVLLGIVYCHDNNIVHRDLKLDNILLANKGSASTLKIIDFGASTKFKIGSNERMKELKGTVRLFFVLVMVLKPYYVAPEVLVGNYNEKCDIWSLGILLYVLLCGYPPFSG